MTEDSFFSIDRLVEFGMGLTMAQQMIKMMNESMQNMYIPVTQMLAMKSQFVQQKKKA